MDSSKVMILKSRCSGRSLFDPQWVVWDEYSGLFTRDPLSDEELSELIADDEERRFHEPWRRETAGARTPPPAPTAKPGQMRVRDRAGKWKIVGTAVRAEETMEVWGLF